MLSVFDECHHGKYKLFKKPVSDSKFKIIYFSDNQRQVSESVTAALFYIFWFMLLKKSFPNSYSFYIKSGVKTVPSSLPIDSL